MLRYHEEPEFRLYQMMNGGMHAPLCLGSLPDALRTDLGWNARPIYLTRQTAQKIRYCTKSGHGLGFSSERYIFSLINSGDAGTDRDRWIWFALSINNANFSWLFMPAKCDHGDRAIFVRSLYAITDSGMSRKLKRSRLLRKCNAVESKASSQKTARLGEAEARVTLHSTQLSPSYGHEVHRVARHLSIS